MGLDITAIANIGKPRDCDSEDCDCAVVTGAREFMARLDDLPEGHYSRFGSERLDFHAGSCSGYNHWREELCKKALGCWPREVWAKRPMQGRFVELIDFSDCEGAIGPKTCAKLAMDFREAALADPKDDSRFAQLYRRFERAFEVGSENGVVLFH